MTSTTQARILREIANMIRTEGANNIPALTAAEGIAEDYNLTAEEQEWVENVLEAVTAV